MAMLSSREKELIKYLAQSNTWVSSHELIAAFGISMRTLRSLVKSINSNCRYIVSSSKGYKIAGDARAIEEALRDRRENGLDNNREETILKELLLSKTPVDYFRLAEDLCISEQTLLSAVTSLKKRISQYEVTIIRRKETIALKGTERNIRRLFGDTIYKEAERSILNVSVLNEFFVDIDVSELKNKISQFIDGCHFKINDFALNNIVLHVCIIIDRNKYEKQELFERNGSENSSNIQYSCAVKIADWISERYGFLIGKSDFEDIHALLIIGMKETSQEADSSDIAGFVDPEILSFVKTLIVQVYNEYYINLDNNEFLSNFALHLNNVIHRRMAMRNPLLTSIKDSYPAIYEVSVFIAKQIQDRYPQVDMNDHQISYIALHVGAQIEKQALTKIKAVIVNPEYLKLNALILSKLETSFSNELSIRMVSDESELRAADLDHYELIITTVPLQGYFSCRVVHVSVFINQKDIERIFAAISEIKRTRDQETEALLRYFDGTFCYFDNYVKDYEDVVRKLCETHPDLDDDFLKRVMIREEMSPSEYKNIAAVHPIQCDEKTTFITIGIFKKPFRWRKNDINIVFLLSVSQKDKTNFLKILRQLIEIFSSSRWMERHSYINTYEKFIAFIKEYASIAK